jgi:ATP-binding cassette subfamily F protein 3
MMMLQASNLSISFGSQQVLDDVSIKVTTHSRIGLVGANGGGKSTLLKCLMRELPLDEGKIVSPPHYRIQCLTQNPHLTAGNTLQEELYSVFTELNEAKAEEQELLADLATLTGKEREVALKRLAMTQETQERLGGGDLEANISRMVTGLGFTLAELNQPVELFSGGWQMRINLAKVLLQGADIILMDEPTNHLDMEACQWLENFLAQYPGGIVVVSHDRRFLDEVVTEIAEIERGSLTLYAGNYAQYLEQKAENRARQAAAAERQQKMLAEQQTFVDRFRASATKSTQAKSREKQLAKIERIEAPQGDLKTMHVKFPLAETSGREVLTLRNIKKAYTETPLYTGLNAALEWTKDKPQRVFILGANGCGKTTLFKLLMGIEQPDEGNIVFGNRVKLGYYAQHQLQILDAEKTAYETLEHAMKATHQAEIRGILGRFLFTNDQVHKKVGVLSGGEKGRLALAKLMVTGPNTLLLDEPTNHLDIPAQEAVESALQDYQGTIICISHDRYFIQSLATQIWEFHLGKLIVFDGGYNEYLKKRKQLLATVEASVAKAAGLDAKQQASKSKLTPEQVASVTLSPDAPIQARKDLKYLQKNLKQTETRIGKLATAKKELEERMAVPSVVSDYLLMDKLARELEALEGDIEKEETKWETLAEQLAAMGATV